MNEIDIGFNFHFPCAFSMILELAACARFNYVSIGISKTLSTFSSSDINLVGLEELFKDA